MSFFTPDQVTEAKRQQNRAAGQIPKADEQQARANRVGDTIQSTGEQQMQAARDQGALSGTQAAQEGAARQSSADYLGNIEDPMARGQGGYSADEASAIENKGGLADLSQRAGDIGTAAGGIAPSADYLAGQQMSPEEQQRLVTQAGISAGAGASAAKEAIANQVAAAGGTPGQLAAYRARLDRQSAGEQGDAMTNARVAASNAAASRAQGAEQQREAGLTAATGQQLNANQQGLGIQGAASGQAKSVADTRLGAQQQGLQYYQGQNTQANANQQAGLTRQQDAISQGNQAYGTQAGGTVAAANAGTSAVNAGTSAVDAGTKAVDAQTEASQVPSGFDKAVGAATGLASAFKLADGDYLSHGTNAVVGEAGPEKVVNTRGGRMPYGGHESMRRGKMPSFMAEGGFSSGGMQQVTAPAQPQVAQPVSQSPTPATPAAPTMASPAPAAPAQSPAASPAPGQSAPSGGYSADAGAGMAPSGGRQPYGARSAQRSYYAADGIADFSSDDPGQNSAMAPPSVSGTLDDSKLPFWKKLAGGAGQAAPAKPAAGFNPVSTYSSLGNSVGKLIAGGMSKKPGSQLSDGQSYNVPQQFSPPDDPGDAMADGGITPTFHGGWHGQNGIFTRPTSVKLEPGEAVVPLSYRATAKIRPSMAAMPAAKVRQPYMGMRR